MHSALWSKKLAAECTEAGWLPVRVFTEAPLRMDWVSGILLKMKFSAGSWNEKEKKKPHSIRIHSLSPFSLPCKEEGFILTALMSGLSCMGQGGKTPKPQAVEPEGLSWDTEWRRQGRGRVGDPYRLHVMGSFRSGFGSRKESKISGSSCHLCRGYWE